MIHTEQAVDQAASKQCFVAREGDLDGVKRNKALLVGSAAFISLRDMKAESYIKVPPRSTSTWRKAMGKKALPKLYVAVHNNILVSAPKNMRFAFAVDAYLAWGFRQKGGAILLAGYEDSSNTSVEVFVFKDGILTSFEDNNLPSQGAAHFQDSFATLIETLKERFPKFRMSVAAPLHKPNSRFAQISYVDEGIFSSLSYRPIQVFSERKLSEFRWPAVVLGCAALFYAGSVAKGWMEYQAATDAFDEASSDSVVKERGGVDSALIDTIQQRRFFLDQVRHQEILAAKAKQLMAGIAQVNGVKIIEVKLPAPSRASGQANMGVPSEAQTGEDDGKDKPDVWIKISVPASSVGVWDQSYQLMQELSKHTGMDLRMSRREGWTEDSGTHRRTYSLEGTIRG